MAKGERKDFKGVHRVTKKLATGEKREYHYPFRGGPCFWKSTDSFRSGYGECAIALADALRCAPTGIKAAENHSTAAVIDRYRKSAHFTNLKSRTQHDYEKYLVAFEADFGEDPAKTFEEKASISENEREARIMIAVSEGGMAPQDLGILKREHVQRTPKGRRLFFKRMKSKKAVSIQ